MTMKKRFPIIAKTIGLYGEKGLFNKKRKYRIPAYQRSYEWKIEQVDSLLQGLLEAYQDKKEFFIGTMIFHERDDQEFDVVDGQQRMTTLFLLFYFLKKKRLGEEKELSAVLTFAKDFFRDQNIQEEMMLSGTDEKEKRPDDQKKKSLYDENYNYIEKYDMEVDEQFVTFLLNKVYLIELVIERNTSLADVIKVFQVINTTGLELNCSDVFKIRYADYLSASEGNKEEWISKINMLYDKVKEDGEGQMDWILTILKHLLCAEHEDIKWEQLAKSNASFFKALFDGKLLKKPKDSMDRMRYEALEYKNFEKLIELTLQLFGKIKEGVFCTNIAEFSYDLICNTRYSRYWTVPFIYSYFHLRDGEEDRERVFQEAMEAAYELAKYFIVYSVNRDKVISEVQNKMCNKILNSLKGQKEELRKELTMDEAAEKELFQERISKNLTSNALRCRIVCRYSALLEEVSNKARYDYKEVRKKLFIDKNYDIEHILANNQEEETKDDPKRQSLGNLLVLEAKINRGWRENQTLKQKLNKNKNQNSYWASNFKIVESFRTMNEHKEKWGLEDIEKRLEEEKEKVVRALWGERTSEAENKEAETA